MKPVDRATALRVSELRNELADAMAGDWTVFEALAAISMVLDETLAQIDPDARLSIANSIAGLAVSRARRSIGLHDA